MFAEFFTARPKNPIYFVRKIKLQGSVSVERLTGVRCRVFLGQVLMLKSLLRILLDPEKKKLIQFACFF
ncbi:hypothetical protein EHQ05_08175 [Leptospira yasudae]|nr:hypothetical protein EHQ05_08175 [Leptospira yasudae]TGM06881.1 hypothetical protein EHQ86_08230 [Leptospira yasudae]